VVVIHRCARAQRAAPLSTLPRGAGFALHDDDDDVYGGGDERFALTAFAGEDDADVRPGRLLAEETLAPSAGGRLRDAATRRPGTLAGFSRAAAMPPPPPPAALTRPPQAWRGVHAFQTPPLASPWLAAARSGRAGEVAADGVARCRTALEGEVPAPEPEPLAPAPAAPARPTLGAAGAFEGLARAMGSRFATASTSDATRPAAEAVPRGGLSAPPARPLPAAAPLRARAEPASWAEPPTRLSNPWQPLPLLCKRFGIPVPRVVSNAAALRDRQFGRTAQPRVTTGATASKKFDATVGAFLPGSAGAASTAAPLPRDAPLELPRAPDAEFSSVFDRDDDDDSPVSARQAPTPRESPGDLFSALISAPPRARRKEKRRSGNQKKKRTA
jgi:hypothetical protein